MNIAGEDGASHARGNSRREILLLSATVLGGTAESAAKPKVYLGRNNVVARRSWPTRE